MNRREEYRLAFNKADIERKIRAIKAMDSRGRLAIDYEGVGEHIESIVYTLEFVYSGDWDVVLQNNSEEEDRYLRPFELEFLIRFEEFTIKNSKNSSHIIKDLFIKLKPLSEGGRFSFKGFTGRRLTLSPIEYNSDYTHSHIGTYYYNRRATRPNSGHNYHEFCLGESEIVQAILLLRSLYNEKIFTLFLFQLEEYVVWESLEGTPYTSIDDITNKYAPDILSNTIIQRESNKILQYRKEEFSEVDFIIKDNCPELVDNEKLENFLKIHSDRSRYPLSIVCSKDGAGNYSKCEQSSEDIYINEEVLESTKITFRGREIKFNIQNDSSEEQTNYYLHPQIKEYVIKEFNKKAKKSFLRDYITKQLDTFNNTPKMSETDTVFMPED